MNHQQDWRDEFEASEADLAESVEVDSDEDPEAYAADEEVPVPDDADAADAVEQAWEVPADEDDEARPE